MADKSPEVIEAEKAELERSRHESAENEKFKRRTRTGIDDDEEEDFEDAGEEEQEEEEIQIPQMRVEDLRAALRLRGLSPTGNKAILISRLEQALEEQNKKKEDEIKKKPQDKKEDDPGGTSKPEIEAVEKKLNQAKSSKERKEQQMKKVLELLKQEEEQIAELKKQKKKLLSSPAGTANTEDFRRKILGDIEKKRAKKKLFQDDPDNVPDNDDDDHNDDDNISQGTRYSQAWSLFGMTPLKKIKSKIDKALVIAEKATNDHQDDKEVLKSAKRTCQDAQSYVENNADKISEEDITPEEKEEIEDLVSDLDDNILNLDVLLSKIDTNRAERSTGIKPSSPKWDSLHPSGFLSFHKAFKEAYKHQSSRIKCEAYRSAIVGTDRRSTISLIAGIDDNFDEIDNVMMKHYGDITSLLPSERAKIAALRVAHTEEEEKDNLLVILEHWHLLQSHNAEHHFDFGLKFQIKRVLKKEHSSDLRLRKPADTAEFVARLEEYLADVTEYLRVFDKEKKKKPEEEKNGRYKNGRGGDTPGIRQYSTGFQLKKRCSLCKSEDSHWTSDCNQIKGKSVQEVKEILSRKGTCHICLRSTLNTQHSTPCNKQYFNKRENRKAWRTCRCCGLNNRICRNPTAGRGASDSTTPAAGGSRGAGGSRRDDDAPITASNSMKIHQQRGQVLLNGDCGIGESVSNSQMLRIKLPGSNDTVNVIAVYDSQSQNCLFDDTMKKYVEDYRQTVFNVETVNDTVAHRGGVGSLTIIANNGKEYKVKGLVKQIHNRNITPARFIIPKKWMSDYNMKEVEHTCSGQISIVIGNDLKQFFPTKIDSYGGVDLEQSFFDKKLILSGYNKNEVFSGTTNRTVRSNRTNLMGIDKSWLEVMNPQQAFITPALCPAHKGTPECVDCKNQLNCKTRLQLHEENLLADGLSFNDNTGRWEVKAPYKANIDQVPDYTLESKAAMERLVRRLKATPNGEKYASSLNETVRQNLKEDMWAWQDDLIKENEDFKKLPHIITPINIALKESQTTAVRLVHNLSFKRANKPSFNDAQLTGSSLNQKIHLILLRQRGFKFLAYNDLKRFYNQVSLCPEDMAKHSFLYKKDQDGPNLLGDGEFKIICSKRLVFGAKMSQNLANLAKIRTSETHILPVDTDVHEDVLNSYTDDISTLSNISLEDIDRKKKIMQDGLARGGFPVKGEWVTSHDKNEEKANRNISGFSSTMLGCFYTPSSDSWAIKANVNFAKKSRGLRPSSEQLHTREELRDFINKKGLTKLNCLQAAHQLFDPLCLLLPIKANLSLAYRQLLIKNPAMGYGDKLPDDQVGMWEIVIGNLLDAKEVKIPRCVLPESFTPDTPVALCVFCDGGESASTTRVFVRIRVGDGDYHVANVFNTFRLGDLSNSGAPKSEVSGLLNACRNIELVLTIWKHIKFSSLHIFSDSTVCLATLEAVHSKLKLYFSDRILEIQRIIYELSVKVHFISGTENPANYGSKLDLGPNPVLSEDYWRVPFLELEEKDWPVKNYQYDISDIASLINPKMANEEEKTSMSLSTRVSLNTDVPDLIGRFSFKKIINILSYYYQWKKEFRGDSVKAQEQARLFMYNLANPTEEQISGLKRQYVITKEGEGEIFLISRPFTLEDQTLQRKLRLLDGRSLVGRSILRSYHVHCQSVDRQLCKMYEDGLFLVGSRSYLKRMLSECKTCTRIRQTTIQSLQGPSPTMEASLHPAYHTSCADVVGPILVKTRKGLDTRGSQPRKAYILSLTCLWSRHLSLTLLDDLQADTFLTALLTISSQLGGATPTYLHSDFGTNIVTLKKLAGDDVGEGEADKITRALRTTFRSNGINLVLSSPRAPWRQGILERLHRNFKDSLRRSNLYHQTLDITRWNYVLSKMAQSINERPLNIRFTNEKFEVLTPTKLIFGERQGYFPRCVQLDLGPHSLYSQLEKLERSVESWRAVWQRSYAESIQKFLVFRTESMKLRPDDVVMITDHKGPGGGSAIGQVVEVLSDRTVKLQYVQRQAKYDKEKVLVKPARMGFLIRPTQKLVYLTSPSEKFRSLDPFEDNLAATTTATTSATTSATATATATAPATDPTSGPLSPDDGNVNDISISATSEPDSDGSEGGDRERGSPTSVVTVKYVPDAEVVSEIKDIVKSRKQHKKKKNI